MMSTIKFFFFFSSRRRHTRYWRDWSSDVCSSDLMSPPENKISPLKNPVTSLWGVGAERAAQLARLEIFTIEDLLLHRPKRYEDRRHFRKISELTKDEAITARGKIVALGLKRFRGGSKSVFEIIL